MMAIQINELIIKADISKNDAISKASVEKMVESIVMEQSFLAVDRTSDKRKNER